MSYPIIWCLHANSVPSLAVSDYTISMTITTFDEPRPFLSLFLRPGLHVHFFHLLVELAQFLWWLLYTPILGGYDVPPMWPAKCVLCAMECSKYSGDQHTISLDGSCPEFFGGRSIFFFFFFFFESRTVQIRTLLFSIGSWTAVVYIDGLHNDGSYCGLPAPESW